MPSFDHFDLLAPIYDRVIRMPNHNELAHHAQLPVPGPLLDAGGGTGRIAHSLVGLAGQVIVADASVKMLAKAHQKHDLPVVASQTESLPFSTGTFQRIIMVDAYHHVENQPLTLSELWRVLAPAGLLVIEEPDIRKFAVKMIALGEKITLMRSHFETGDRIAHRLQALGARTQIHCGYGNVWITATKPASIGPEASPPGDNVIDQATRNSKRSKESSPHIGDPNHEA